MKNMYMHLSINGFTYFIHLLVLIKMCTDFSDNNTVHVKIIYGFFPLEEQENKYKYLKKSQEKTHQEKKISFFL